MVTLTRPVGQKFTSEGDTYVVVAGDCKICSFWKKRRRVDSSCTATIDAGYCKAVNRQDSTNVAFIYEEVKK